MARRKRFFWKGVDDFLHSCAIMFSKKKPVKYILGFPQKTLFVFFALLVFSIGFFVSADSNTATSRSIFLDADQDGLSDDEEKIFGTDPLKRDTDGDSYSDGIEVESGYDPLKPAPGDRLVAEDDGLGKGGYDDSSDMSLTEAASSEVAKMLSQNTGAAIDMNTITASIETLLQQTAVDVEDPEVKKEDVNVRTVKCKSSDSEEECTQRKKEATEEYLTVLAYLVANNSPVPLNATSDLEVLSSTLLKETSQAFSLNSFSFLKEASTKADTFLVGLKDIEVPENMLETHIKAMRLGLFARNLGEKYEQKTDDPIAQIALLGELQGILGIAMDLSNDMMTEFANLGIESIPIEFSK